MTSNLPQLWQEIFTEVKKKKFEIQKIAQMAADITAILEKISHDLLLNRGDQMTTNSAVNRNLAHVINK